MAKQEHYIAYFPSSQGNWDLHRKGLTDHDRHQEKVKEIIKGNLHKLISEEAIITSDGQKIVKIPIRNLELPRFRYDHSKREGVGTSEGNSQPGDVIGQRQAGPGRGKQAGDQPGIDYYEAEVTIDEITQIFMEDLGLPNLQPKEKGEIKGENITFTDIAKKGLRSNLDKRRFIKETIRRRASHGQEPVFEEPKEEDMRFRVWKEEIRRESNAVIIAMRDISASMGEFEKYISRSFYFWMMKFLRHHYDGVEVVFITHHTEAKEVNEEDFFKLGESGGTKVSSAYKLSLDLIGKRFDPTRYNIYPFHFSDGDNWGDGDNALCLALAQKLLEVCNLFGYGEIQERGQNTSSTPSTLMHALSSISNEKFIPLIITDKTEVYPALRKFFGREEERLKKWAVNS